MATIRQKGVGQWHAQVRKKGFPPQTKTFRTEAEAKAWATVVEADMIRGVHIGRTDAQRETFGDLVDRYLKEVTDKRPDEASRIAERARLERFLRVEKSLCSYAVALWSARVQQLERLTGAQRLSRTLTNAHANTFGSQNESSLEAKRGYGNA